ncbi:hypothetical protein V8C35DRAFT_255032 [Trichoderma chlorosporum]
MRPDTPMVHVWTREDGRGAAIIHRSVSITARTVRHSTSTSTRTHPSHDETRQRRALACTYRLGKGEIGQPSFVEWVCCGLWPVGFRLDPVLEAFPQPTRQVDVRARTRWDRLGFLGWGPWDGQLGGMAIVLLCFSCAPPSLHHGLQLKFSSAGQAGRGCAPGLGGTPLGVLLSLSLSASAFTFTFTSILCCTVQYSAIYDTSAYKSNGGAAGFNCSSILSVPINCSLLCSHGCSSAAHFLPGVAADDFLRCSPDTFAASRKPRCSLAQRG